MIKAIAIDDEPLALELLKVYCEKIKGLSLIRTFTKVNEAHKYLKNYPIDLIFLDIQMPMQTGIEFYEQLDEKSMVIFTSAYSEYAIEGFNLQAVDYLLKPYSYARFTQAIKKVFKLGDLLKDKTEDVQKYLLVRSEYSLQKINFEDILYIESFADYLNIHLQSDKKVTIRMSLKKILEKLPSDNFLRVHRSFIVALDKIEKVRKKHLYIEGIAIPLSSSFEEIFFNKFSNV